MSTTTNERVRRPAGATALAIGGALLRFALVGAALGVPAYVVWEQRAVVAPVFAAQTVARAPTAEGWATVMLGAPSGTPPRPRPVEAQPAAVTERSPDSREGGSASNTLADASANNSAGTSSAGASDRRATNTPPPVPVPEPTTLPPDFEVVVAKGVTLGEISQTYYNTSRPRWVAALAAYNGLADANKVRLGQKLRVPHRDKLGLD